MRALRTVVLVALLTACGSGPSPYEALTAGPRSTAPGPTTAGPAGLPPDGAATATTAPASDAATTAPAPASTSSPAPTSAGGVPLLAPPTTAAGVSALLAQARGANQAIVVSAPRLDTSTATLTAFTRTAGGWTPAFGPWTARIGRNGFAPPNEKREGDGRTPSGAYPFDFFFGVEPNPGVKFPYRVVTQSIVWVEDPSSPLYNQWVDRNQQAVRGSVEEMYQPTAYRHGAVIAYNAARTPNLGSAIFLHAATGEATAGCVTLPLDQLVQVLKWLDPAQNPRIVMGVG